MKTNILIFAAAVAVASLGTGARAQPAATAPDRVIYVPQLPTATDLVNAGKAQGLAVSRIEQTSDSVTAVYAAADGRAVTVVYHPISSVGSVSSAVPQPATPAPAVSVEQTAAPAVVYGAPEYVDYYAYPYGYGPWWGWPAVSIGLGWGWGGYYGGYHGGFHGDGGYRGGGGFHGAGGGHDGGGRR